MARPKKAINNEVIQVYEKLIEKGRLRQCSAGYKRYQELRLINSRDD
mgnify:CR=1 FL=1|jgi:hypothetical protein